MKFKKAFDTVNWKFIQKCLQTMNFGEYFTNYTNITSCVVNYGYISPFFISPREISNKIALFLANLFILKLLTGIRPGLGISPGIRPRENTDIWHTFTPWIATKKQLFFLVTLGLWNDLESHQYSPCLWSLQQRFTIISK